MCARARVCVCICVGCAHDVAVNYFPKSNLGQKRVLHHDISQLMEYPIAALSPIFALFFLSFF